MLIEILKVVLPLLIGGIGGGLLMHYLNIKKERESAIFTEKRKNYERLLEAIRGFTEGNPEQKEQFISEMNRSWLYASDEVVKQTREFLDLYVKSYTSSKSNPSALEVDPAIGSILVAMRRDLGFKGSKLSPTEFHVVCVAKNTKNDGLNSR